MIINTMRSVNNGMANLLVARSTYTRPALASLALPLAAPAHCRHDRKLGCRLHLHRLSAAYDRPALRHRQQQNVGRIGTAVHLGWPECGITHRGVAIGAAFLRLFGAFVVLSEKACFRQRSYLSTKARLLSRFPPRWFASPRLGSKAPLAGIGSAARTSAP